MSDDAFQHDRERFERAAVPGGVDVADAEARYADLFAEIIWDGTITADKRQRLQNAAQTFQLPQARVEQIERSLLAAHQARYQYTIVEEETNDLLGGEDTFERPSVAPFAAAEEPGLRALQKRIGVLEEQAFESDQEKQRLRNHIRALEQLVEQLQFALESTLEELDDTHQELERHQSAPPSPSASAVIELPAAHRGAPVFEAGAPNHSLAQQRTGRFDGQESWDAETVVEPPREPAQRDNPDVLFERLRGEPRSPELLDALYRSLGRGEDLDRKWCIAHVLVFIGHADLEQSELCASYAGEGLVRPARAVNDDEWRELLFHPDEDPLTGEILSAIAPAVLLGHMTAIRASIAPELLDPSTRVDTKTSTLQAVRCMSWAAAILGLNEPPIYVVPEVRAAAEIVLNPTPSTRLGSLALSGRDTRELAFIAGRHLAWYRREHLLGKPQRSTRRLEDMFLAALMIGNPGLPMTPEVKERVEPIKKTLLPLIDASTVEMLQRCFSRFVEQGGRTSLSRWFRSVEHTAAASGLLLANDLGAAQRMLALEDGTKAASELDELIMFFTSRRCTLLRKRIGIAVG